MAIGQLHLWCNCRLCDLLLCKYMLFCSLFQMLSGENHSTDDKIKQGIGRITGGAYVVYSAYENYLGSSFVSWGRNRSFDRYETLQWWLDYNRSHRAKASLSTLYLILWFCYPANHYYMAFAFVMGGIYANSLMVIFNSRTMISDRRAEPQIVNDVEANLFKETWPIGRKKWNTESLCSMGLVPGRVAKTSSKFSSPSRGDTLDENIVRFDIIGLSC